MAQILMLDAHQQADLKFSENTYTEWTQQVILLIMVITFGICASRYASSRALSIVLSGCAGIGLVREFNNFFKEQVFDGAWQLLAAMVLIAAVWIFYPHRKQLISNLKQFHGTLSEGVMLAGFVTTFVFSRLFGWTPFWQAIMEDRYFRSVKNAAEEGIELLGYGLLFIACMEYWLLQKSLSEKN